MDDRTGIANVQSAAPVELRVDGACLAGTLDNLREGHGAKPMPEAALTKVRADAIDLLDHVVRAYERDVAKGEVGARGTGHASRAAPSAGRCPTGLLYGRIQSGKTVAMISFAAAALDNGFRVIVVLTSDFVKLVEQTAARFTALSGALVRNSLASKNWDDDAEHIAKNVAERGVVFVCAKDNAHLARLVTFLQKIHADDFPALVLDDEADAATLDTTTAARASGRPNAPTKGSAIHRRTVRNDSPSEEGESIREKVRHHVFVQVTATPYALLLQSVDTPLRPSFARLLEPGDGYTGGEAFFDDAHVDPIAPPLVEVDEGESALIESGPTEPPLGLKHAIAFFLVAAGAQNILMPSSRAAGQNFLCHTSHKKGEHRNVAVLIRGYLGRVGDELRGGALLGETAMRFQAAHDELRKTIPDAPSLDDIVARVKQRLPRREVPVVNSDDAPADFGRELNFIVGGNILGRGLTIENLLVTYYIRQAKVSQMDTVLQHARMYGYRRALMPFTRVFLPEQLAFRFHHIHVAESNLRRQLREAPATRPVSVETMQALRPTRLNVLDTGSLFAFEPGTQVYPTRPAFDDRSLERAKEVEAMVAAPMGGKLERDKFFEVPLDQFIQLVEAMPYDEEEANSWMPNVLSRVLRNIGPRYGNVGLVRYRPIARGVRGEQSKGGRFSTGAASGPERKEALMTGKPVLFAFRDDGKALAQFTRGREFWYPTLVLPEDMPNQVFNTTG